MVMYGGKIQELAPVKELFKNPMHPYTKGLLASLPRVHGEKRRAPADHSRNVPSILDLPAGCKFITRCPERFEKCFDYEPELVERAPGHLVRCVLVREVMRQKGKTACRPLEVRTCAFGFLSPAGCSHERSAKCARWTAFRSRLNHGETLGLVGESGCGKTTVGRAIINILRAMSYGWKSQAKVLYHHQNGVVDLASLTALEMRPYRSDIQMIFQDPYSSLESAHDRQPDRRRAAEDSHEAVDARSARVRVHWLMDKVGLSPEHVNRYPHEFSGGQRQRIGIARALATNPQIVIADEPVSALDVSIQAQVINLMQDLQEEFGLSYIFIAHDLSVVRHISDRIAVMFKARSSRSARPTASTSRRSTRTRARCWRRSQGLTRSAAVVNASRIERKALFQPDRGSVTGRSFCICAATASTCSSPRCPPATCNPTGMPAGSSPAGTHATGSPVRLSTNVGAIQSM